jgi:DNA-binding SARP family transcriptional activator
MVAPRRRPTAGGVSSDAAHWPVLICLLGRFRILARGEPRPIAGGKAEALLSTLALADCEGIPRDSLLLSIWPTGEPALAGQSLNSLVYSLHKRLGVDLDGAAPVLHVDGWYRLNLEAGVGVDTHCFDHQAAAGEWHARTGDPDASRVAYQRAVELYRGDLCVGTDVQALVERERLRASYLTLLARLADLHFAAGEYTACLDHALSLLAHDSCREDAHRLVMRCFVRRGERAQALHQYRVCESILKAEFSAAPEPATISLFDQVRIAPDTV